MKAHSTTSICRILLGILAGTILLVSMVSAQTPPPDGQSKYEMRGAWIATVLGLDWPSTSDSELQQAELIRMLDRLQALGINTVFFQIRTEADAMYQSPYEPWSFWLTGQQGKAPAPFYDPLALAVKEAHRRGMELHAWLNPFRASREVGRYAIASDHVVNENPEWTLSFGNLRILNPGLPEVRDYVSSVIADVVRRYDVDGIHFDDYFYPYPPNSIQNEDITEYNADKRGFQRIGDWRRDNINLFIQQVADSVEAIKPFVKYGVSPFGIWKPGVPAGIAGLDAFNSLYADPVAWLDDQSVDYLLPQLYWGFGGGQDYAKLANWWATQMNGRHLYVGHGLYRSESRTFSGTLYSASEVPRQVRFNRERDGIHGGSFFRTKNLTSYGSKGFADSLSTTLMTKPALTPSMDWKDLAQPPPVINLAAGESEEGSDREVVLTWDLNFQTSFESVARRFAIYRFVGAQPPDDPLDWTRTSENLIAVTGDYAYTDLIPGDVQAHYTVASVSANSIESYPVDPIAVGQPAVATEESPEPTTFDLDQNFPNPITGSAQITFELRELSRVTLEISDSLGRPVQTLLRQRVLQPGAYVIPWDVANSGVAAGTYYYTLRTSAGEKTRSMILMR